MFPGCLLDRPEVERAVKQFRRAAGRRRVSWAQDSQSAVLLFDRRLLDDRENERAYRRLCDELAIVQLFDTASHEARRDYAVWLARRRRVRKPASVSRVAQARA